MNQTKMITSIATKKSRDLIKKYNKMEKEGQSINWNEVFVEVRQAEAKGKDQEMSAILEKKK